MHATPAAQPILTEIAPGELIDKITILQIKNERIKDPGKLHNVRVELAALESTRDKAMPASPELARLTADLKSVNEALWEIEDEIRVCEANKDFDARFIELARSVYRTERPARYVETASQRAAWLPTDRGEGLQTLRMNPNLGEETV